MFGKRSGLDFQGSLEGWGYFGSPLAKQRVIEFDGQRGPEVVAAL